MVVDSSYLWLNLLFQVQNIRFDLSITNICNRIGQIRKVEQPIKIKPFMPININYYPTLADQNWRKFLTLGDRQEQLETNVDQITWFNGFYSNMFSLDFDSPFSTVELKVSCILLLTQWNGNRTSCRTVQVVFPTQAEYIFFSVNFRLNILVSFLVLFLFSLGFVIYKKQGIGHNMFFAV